METNPIKRVRSEEETSLDGRKIDIRPLKKIKVEEVEEVPQESQELVEQAQPVDKFEEQFYGEGIVDPADRQRFIRDLDSISYIQRRNDTVVHLHTLEEVLGYTDPFAELVLCSAILSGTDTMILQVKVTIA